ncbi:hypothetical protein DEA98_06745 [Brucella pseudogrignonensis]|nr:hypothetical protein [Brucella pseudogrignonensis]
MVLTFRKMEGCRPDRTASSVSVMRRRWTSALMASQSMIGFFLLIAKLRFGSGRCNARFLKVIWSQTRSAVAVRINRDRPQLRIWQYAIVVLADLAKPENPSKTDLGARIRLIRKEFGDAERENFASQLGISKNTLAYYERGERTPDATTLASYRDRFGININWLVTGEGSMLGNASETVEKTQRPT